MRGFALSPDAKSVVAALPAKALMRIVRIPLDGRGVPNDLFTVTSDVWHMDVDANGSMLVNLIDRPGEVVRLTSTGAPAARLARFLQASASKMVVALADGRDVVGMSVSGRMRLMLMQSGKALVPLLKTQDESASPMTALSGNRIAFAIGPEPRETIAIADTQSGRITGRISPGKGSVQTLAASSDGATLYFTAGGSVWSVASAGGESHRICAGEWIVAHPSGTLIVTRNEAAQIQLFEVDAVRGTERAIPADSATRIYGLGQVRPDSVMVAPMMAADSWFNPLGLVDLKSGRSTRLAGDGASDLISAAWTADGQIVALRQGLSATIWTFTPQVR